MAIMGGEDLWESLLSFHEEVDRLLEGSLYATGGQELASTIWKPPVDIYEIEDCFVLKMDLPGVNPQSMELEVKDEALHIKGKRAPEDYSNSEPLLKKERPHGDFHRTFSLPRSIEVEKVRARLKDGVLTVIIPKLEGRMPRQITVNMR